MTDEALPIDYGIVDPLATDPRYTTLVDVKRVLGIPTGDVSADARILQAIVAAEYALDSRNGRSFPDGPGVPDVSDPGPIQGIPQAIKVAALDTSVAVYKEADAPVGSAGSDVLFGAIDVGVIARQIISRSVVLSGFKVGAGFGVA